MYRETSGLDFLWKSDKHGDSWQCMDAHESGEIEEYDHVCGTERGNVERREKMTESLGQKEKTEGPGEDKDSGGYLKCQKWRKVRILKSLDGHLLGVGGTEEHRSKEKWIPHVTQDSAARSNVGGSRGLNLVWVTPNVLLHHPASLLRLRSHPDTPCVFSSYLFMFLQTL